MIAEQAVQLATLLHVARQERSIQVSGQQHHRHGVGDHCPFQPLLFIVFETSLHCSANAPLSKPAERGFLPAADHELVHIDDPIASIPAYDQLFQLRRPPQRHNFAVTDLAAHGPYPRREFRHAGPMHSPRCARPARVKVQSVIAAGPGRPFLFA
jgi:hypothetical protein